MAFCIVRKSGLALIVYGIKNCDTVKKARLWLDTQGIAYDFHDYKSAGIEQARLASWCKLVGWETLLNRAGTTFRKLPDSAKQVAGVEAAIVLMLAQPSMIKRPVIEHDGGLLVGFKVDQYEQALSARQGGAPRS
jgi:arsenate reductase